MFTKLACYAKLHEQTFRRHFARTFNWLCFNLVLLRLRTYPEEAVIGVFDTSFLPKSGKHTWGRDNPLFRGFWYGGRLIFANAVFLVGQ